MSEAYNRDDALFRAFTVDRAGVELAALFALVLGFTAWVALHTSPSVATEVSPPSAFGDGASGQAAAGASWAVLEIVFAGALLVLALVYRKLPEWIQELVIWNFIIAALLYFGARGQYLGAPWITLFTITGLYTMYKTLNHFDVYWMINDLFAVGLAIGAGYLLGLMFGVPGMVLALVALTVYDHVFANKESWMFTIGKVIMTARVPVIFVRPSTLRMDWDELINSFDQAKDADEDDEEMENVSWGLGTADMMLPAGFVTAVATAPNGVLAAFGPLAVVAVIVGILVACFRLRFEMLTRGSGAGLPALSAGALVPYVGLAAAALFV